MPTDPINRPDGTIPVASIDEPRVRFYLDNWKLIETWAGIRNEASAALWSCVVGLVDLLQADAAERGEPGLRVRVHEPDRGFARVEMYRPERVGLADQPRRCFMIERESNLINSRGEVRLYAGFRLTDPSALPEQALQAIAVNGAELRTGLGNPWQGGGQWPIWRWIKPEGDGLDENQICRSARSAIWEAWNAGADRFDPYIQVGRLDNHGEEANKDTLHGP